MPYVRTTWVSGSTPTDAAEMNNIETGVVGAYTELESITGNDGATLPSSNGPFTLANFINYLTTLVKSIVGGAHWYSAVPTSLTSLSAGKADLSGATFTGPVIGTTVQATLRGPASSTGVAANDETVVNATVDFSPNAGPRGLRIGAMDGSSAFVSNMRLSNTGVTNFDNTPTVGVGANTVWHAGNDGSGSGLDADKLDGLEATAFVQLDAANEAATPVKIIITDVLPTAGTKGRIAFKVPFTLP